MLGQVNVFVGPKIGEMISHSIAESSSCSAYILDITCGAGDNVQYMMYLVWQLPAVQWLKKIHWNMKLWYRNGPDGYRLNIWLHIPVVFNHIRVDWLEVYILRKTMFPIVPAFLATYLTPCSNTAL